jgi:predicted lipoprotein
MIVPKNMVPNLLKQLNYGLFGAEKCLNRAKDVVFWPNIRKTWKKQTQRSKLKEKNNSTRAQTTISGSEC